MKKNTDWAAGACFLILVLGFSFCSLVWPKKTFSETENRILSGRPQISAGGILAGHFQEDYESFQEDQFPGRDSFIYMETLMARLLGRRDINGVYVGKEGYLIERFTQSDVSGEQLEKNIGYLSDFLNRMDGRESIGTVSVMLVPSAGQIITQYLPDFAGEYREDGIYEALYSLLSPGVIKADVRERLRAHRDEHIYYRTDHHWTSLGAYYGYRVLAEKAGYPVHELFQYDKIILSRDFVGTLAAKINAPVPADWLFTYERQGEGPVQVTYNQEEELYHSIYRMEYLETRDKYGVFLGGNQPLSLIRTENRRGRRLLVVKDSYAHCMVPFLLDGFEEIHLVDLRSFNLDVEEYAKDRGITDVLVLYQTMNFARDRNLYKLE